MATASRRPGQVDGGATRPFETIQSSQTQILRGFARLVARVKPGTHFMGYFATHQVLVVTWDGASQRSLRRQ